MEYTKGILSQFYNEEGSFTLVIGNGKELDTIIGEVFPVEEREDIEEGEANAKRIVEMWNSYDTLKENNRELLEALKQTQELIEVLINHTPSGDRRNHYTNINIIALAAIKNQK